MEQKRQKPPPPPTAARDSGLELSNSKGKNGVPTWTKWVISGTSALGVFGIIVAGLAIAKSKNDKNDKTEKEESCDFVENKFSSYNEWEERREENRETYNWEKEIEKKKKEREERQKEQTRIREERIRKKQEKKEEKIRKWNEEKEEKERNNQQTFLQNAKDFDDNISKIAIFLNNPIEELKKCIVAGMYYDTFDKEIAKELAFSQGYVKLVLEKFKTYIRMYATDIINSKKKISHPVIGRSGKSKNKREWVDDKNGFIIGTFEIKVLSDKKFELKHNGLGLIFESHDLQLQKVEDEAAPVSY